MFTQVINAMLLAVSLVISAQPSQVEVVQLPENVQEQILEINPDSQIELFEDVRSSCSRNGCSLASHK